MKRFMVYSLWVMGLIVLLSGCAPQAGSQQGRAEDVNTWNFGQAEAGRVLKHNFVFKNESKQTLNIKDINTSCGCTVSKVKKKVLSAGESTLIEAKFNTKGYMGQTQQFIYVHTDSLDNPIVRYIIKAEVITNSR